MSTAKNSKLRHAVALSGGGAFGAFEVGVLRALAEGKCPATRGPLDPDAYTGTSVGAFNAAVMAARGGDALAGCARLEDLWMNRIAGGLVPRNQGWWASMGMAIRSCRIRRAIRS